MKNSESQRVSFALLPKIYKCRKGQNSSMLKQEKNFLLFGLERVSKYCLANAYEREKNCKELTEDIVSLIK